MVNFISKSEKQTIETGLKISTLVKAGTVIAFIGDLAAGKTTIIKGIAKGLGVNRDVESPTFTLVNEYYGNLKIYHMDCYRENNIEGWLEIGIEDYFYGDGVSLVEWADRIEELLPEDVIKISIQHDMEHINYRKFSISSTPEREQNIKKLLKLK
ncbi:MAG: tRNA (adenosine(37)-N6)-threonylcarbamoyltransferase complex ATPase subunit type 1 TsaE [Candidatus Marinimicrobia bacterium]|nr:tRNA (adenosine(37)-N6)-threonylcarbamoyltransferase complex ATPase subunit type 1 TsaE [Candidatus Neomarinimicrobiota bacterium]